MKIHNLKLEDMGIQGRGKVNFCNWYNNVIFRHKGHDYVFFTSLKAPGFSGTSNEVTSCIASDLGPVRLRTKKHKLLETIVKDDLSGSPRGYRDIHVVEDPKLHFIAMDTFPADEFFQETVGDTIKVRIGENSCDCRIGRVRVRTKVKDLECDLVFTFRGPVVWWGREPYVGFLHTDKTSIVGYESPSTVEGYVVYKGEKMEVRDGRGNHEHVWLYNLQMVMDIKITDFVIANFDQAYTFFYSTEFGREGEAFRHFETGGLCLPGENEFLQIDKVTMDFTKWAYSPAALRPIPICYRFILETEKGVMTIHAEPLISPVFVSLKWMEEARILNLVGWIFSYWDAPYRMTGNFRFNDGRMIELTNGVGINEPHRMTPIC